MTLFCFFSPPVKSFLYQVVSSLDIFCIVHVPNTLLEVWPAMFICWWGLWRLTWGPLIWRSILTPTPRSPAWAVCTSGGPSSRPRKNWLLKKYLSYNLDEDGRLIIYVLFIWKIIWNDLRVHLLFWMSEQLPILLVRSHCGEYGAECCPGPAGQCQAVLAR